MTMNVHMTVVTQTLDVNIPQLFVLIIMIAPLTNVIIILDVTIFQ
jgi:hypothetical protein